MATEASDYAGLLDRAAHARLVLLGAASHGTHEFHRERAAITRRLIADAGFDAVAVEGDWPDAYRVNRYVRGLGDDPDAGAALGDFRRFGGWSWRNADVAEFVVWLREHNDALPTLAPRAGFYGLDLHPLDERAAARQLAELRGVAPPRRYHEEHTFVVRPSTRRGVAARAYERALARSESAGWNVRARHMTETLMTLAAHLERRNDPARLVVWAHNTLAGDAGATEMGRAGELSLGQLVRRRCAAETVLVGFTTYTGTVTAAREWDEPPEVQRVPPALRDSYEAVFHTRGLRRLVIEPADLPGSRPERSIGVVYRPVEDASHYLEARIGEQFDLVVHIDETHAVQPLGAPVNSIAG
jgi:erythromycin esterase-like protein